LASSFQRTFILSVSQSSLLSFSAFGSAKVILFFILTSFLKKNKLFFYGDLWLCVVYFFACALLMFQHEFLPQFASLLVSELVPITTALLCLGVQR